ncbi:hypothetical protein [Salinispora arenicola]|uniref:hypothetical protein n=1 Tax=Salinispora arenicola TaxID=168697 RepID=UPI00039BA09A|nr:hypothetical protein [Salinispora arenicola]
MRARRGALRRCRHVLDTALPQPALSLKDLALARSADATGALACPATRTRPRRTAIGELSGHFFVLGVAGGVIEHRP